MEHIVVVEPNRVMSPPPPEYEKEKLSRARPEQIRSANNIGDLKLPEIESPRSTASRQVTF